VRTSDIKSLAESTLEAHETLGVPVDPFWIARQERIILVPGQYQGAFDGRIEYRKIDGARRFCLFYAEEESPWRPPGRVRFSIAHELGHYFIPAHREYLLSGRWHGSCADFVWDKPVEREADQFAAALLMPRGLFHKKVMAKRQGVCSLKELLHLASDVFLTSVASTTIRYCELNYEPCCIVVSHKGQIRYCVRSEDMARLGLGWLPKGGRVPIQSVTAGMAALKQSLEYLAHPLEGPVDSEVWFDSRQSYRLWEEAIMLGRTELVLTLLSAEKTSDSDEPSSDVDDS